MNLALYWNLGKTRVLCIVPHQILVIYQINFFVISILSKTRQFFFLKRSVWFELDKSLITANPCRPLNMLPIPRLWKAQHTLKVSTYLYCRVFYVAKILLSGMLLIANFRSMWSILTVWLYGLVNADYSRLYWIFENQWKFL